MLIIVEMPFPFHFKIGQKRVTFLHCMGALKNEDFHTKAEMKYVSKEFLAVSCSQKAFLHTKHIHKNSPLPPLS